MGAGAVTERAGELRRLIRTDPDPRVRHRAQLVLLVAEGEPVIRVARLFRTAAHRIRDWRGRFLERGRDGLADGPRTGRPPTLAAADLALLAEALERGPQAYGWPVTTWSVRDLRELLLQQHGVRVCTGTVYRAVRGLGYRYRSPRHDLKHRQDREAVAAAREVLNWLGKGASPAPVTPVSSTWTNARSTVIPGWRRSGSAAGTR
jgi:transposase